MTNSFSKVIKAGLIVGTLDILGAFTHYLIKTGKNPVIILKYIASGFFGNEAFSGGNMMNVAGLVFHFIFAFVFTIFFFWIFPAIQAFIKSQIVMGILYGIFMWTVMQFIVIPLSKIPAFTINPVNTIISTLILIICIGIPLSFMAGKYYRDAK